MPYSAMHESLRMAWEYLKWCCVVFVVTCMAMSLPSFGAEIGDRFPKARISPTDFLAYEKEVESLPGVRCEYDRNQQFICDSQALNSIWVFTVVGHPAHPAV